MDNRVGENLPTSAEFATRLRQLDEVLAWLREFCVHLSAEERMSLTRGRRGAEMHLVQIAETAKQYGWQGPEVTPDQVLNDLRLVRELDPIRQRLVLASELVEDTMALGSSEANEGGYMFYGMAQSMGSRIPEIEAAVRPFAEFLSNTRRKAGKKDEPGP